MWNIDWEKDGLGKLPVQELLSRIVYDRDSYKRGIITRVWDNTLSNGTTGFYVQWDGVSIEMCEIYTMKDWYPWNNETHVWRFVDEVRARRDGNSLNNTR